jgi:hypothetical protein
MRTVICHFFNEAYMLPWWLSHHVPQFDHGVMIDHGSTDESIEIIRKMAPHWRIVRSRLTAFDAFLTDFEVQMYEQELPGWKVALNVTEFLLSTLPLADIEHFLAENKRTGCAASGFICVDNDPATPPSHEQPLLLQKHWGYDDNVLANEQARVQAGYSPLPYRNRFYHCNPAGMYHPGRHRSFHPDIGLRVSELMVLYCGYTPWNAHLIQRKLQIKAKVPQSDIDKGWGHHHFRSTADLEAEYQRALSLSSDLLEHPLVGDALRRHTRAAKAGGAGGMGQPR